MAAATSSFIWCASAAILLLSFGLTACSESDADSAMQRVVGGDPEQGRAILGGFQYGCAACHAIPGVEKARGTVGPPLHAMALRAYVAGRIPNRPDNLVRWIYNPRLVDPQSAMPKTGISEEEARHVAAYLYTLRELPR
jgi:cytochrome c2